VIVFIMWMPSKQSVTVTVVHSCMEKQDSVHVFVCMCDYVPHDGTQDSKEQKALLRTELDLLFSLSLSTFLFHFQFSCYMPQ